MENLASDTLTMRMANIMRPCAQNTPAAPPRSRVLLNVAGNRIMRGHALNVGVDKLIVSIPSALERGEECAALITVTIEDETFSIVGTAQVVNCSGNDAEGYCAKMRFMVEEEQSRAAIQRLFGSRTSAMQ